MKLEIEKFKEVLQKIRDNSNLQQLRDPNTKFNEKDNPMVVGNKLDSWKLDPIHVALELKVSLRELEVAIAEDGNEAMNLWISHKYLHSIAMFYDPSNKEIKKEIAEHRLKLFSKNAVMTEPIIIQEIEISVEDLEKFLLKEEKEIEEKFKDDI